MTGALYIVVLVAALATRLDRAPGRERTRPWATLGALVLVGVPTLLQFTVAPGLLGAWERDWSRIERGEIWRVGTTLLVQDGGVAGAAFNLVFLAVVGAVAEEVWGRRRWLLIALVAGIGAQLWAWLVQPVGAGNSVVNFGLAASLAGRALRRGPARPRVFAAVSLFGSALLLVLGDLHGGAAALGGVLGAVLARSTRSSTANGTADS